MSAAKAAVKVKQPAQESASSLAIVSLVAGILGLTLVPFLGSILAIVTAIAARNEFRSSEAPVQGQGMATAGLVLGIAGVVFPVLAFCVVGTLVLFPACLAALFTISGFESASFHIPNLLSIVAAI